VNLRVASWWAAPAIYSTAKGQTPACWAPSLGTPGAVEIATSGQWNGVGIGLEGGDGPMFNHAKMGVSTDAATPLCIFGDMNQQGALAPNYAHPNQPCSSSQNGRGGTFFVVSDATLWASLTSLLSGSSAPIKATDGSNSNAGGRSKLPRKRAAKKAAKKVAKRPSRKPARKTAKKTTRKPAKKTAKKVRKK